MKNKRKLFVIFGVIIIPIIIISLIIFFNNNDINESKEEKEISSEVTKLKFRELISIDELKMLENTKVSIVGFLSPISPLDGSFAYLMNMPFQTCPFCVPNTTELANTLTILPKKNNKIEYTTSPIVVEGILKFGDFVDQYEYEYSYRLEDVTIKKADEELVENNISIYGTLAQDGIFDEINNIMAILDSDIYYKYYIESGETNKKIEQIDIEKIDNCLNIIKGYDNEQYSEIISIIERIKEISVKVNEEIAIEKNDELEKYRMDFESVYSDFMYWVTQFEV